MAQPRKHLLDGGQGCMNPFVAMRGDKMAMQPFVKFCFLDILWLMVVWQEGRLVHKKIPFH